MGDEVRELLNVYDEAGAVVGSMERGEAKAKGFAAGAVQLLLVNSEGRVLLQRRRDDKENGGLWDKSVGGHVQAGETFDAALIREANEELFGRADADRVVLVGDLHADALDPRPVRVRRVRMELGLRDIRYAASKDRAVINVTYHAAMYLGRTSLALADFSHQEEELAGLEYFEPAQIDRMLVTGELAPNMAFLWFALGGLATRLV
ncbi:MAG TPA: NUDIX domain-containing protein [Vicinamibacteria bacterium]|nr:NUDIX domain-containing protein [Vicinamibacteria bacterium]HRB12757.1 NUDIX domain-containing protein [Vicinamibacteria bacterium]